MTLIKCPECGREISDKAIECPQCKTKLKGTEPAKKLCLECGGELSNEESICSKCGCPVLTEEQMKGETKKNKKKKQSIKITLICLGIIVLLVYISCLFKQDNIFKEYTDFIGKQQDTLPNDFKKEEIMDGYWIAKKELYADENEFPMVDSSIDYIFSEEVIAYDIEPNELFSMYWNLHYDTIALKDVEYIQDILKKTYGNYDQKLELDNSSDEFSYENYNFICERYIWENENDLEIFLDVEKEGEEFSSIEISWRQRII
ncbi:zinc ribbon domain-containing protein [Mediterraneibacter sp. NSJ-55]|uniref:Zinc ribbon domain-containing protein n=1 Tax=Mediterraneibacter hominis TaxID=2763054 RepID=A0A923RPM9_9FIRM|nr:zinc ribbon domain-containing protein [Mediterraneibacter hominis]MBC5688694.1 zinc ribbon domain-containing protein [Mediterraneibacter hominis]